MGTSETLNRLPLAGIVAIVAAGVAALLWNPVPLEVPRPPSEPPQWRGADELQRMDARQWEDPLAVMDRFRRQHRKSGEPPEGRDAAPRIGLDKICSQLFAESSADTPARFLVLGVMVSNSTYADVSEQRARMRHAVLSALHTGHFIPYHSQRLGLAVDAKGMNPGYRRGELLVPFEVFERRPQLDTPEELSNRSRTSSPSMLFKVLVLWLQEERFTGAPGSVDATPISHLRHLSELVVSGCARFTSVDRRALPTHEFDTAVIGPASSDGLRAMVLEAMRMKQLDIAASDYRYHPVIYSALATSSAVDLLALNLRQPRVPCPLSSNYETDARPWPTQDWRASYEANPRWTGSVLYWFFNRCKMDFFSTISTDEELSHVLLEELKRRDPNGRGVEDERYRVVLVHERDTYYGRTLPKAFVRAARKTKECSDDMFEQDVFVAGRLGGAARPGDKSCTIAAFSYARGMDGEQPPIIRDDKAAQQGKDAAVRVAQEEFAAGLKQFDYLRRLAAQIVDYERALAAADERSWYRRIGPNAETRIRAIGIVGSDVYDKLAVLRALRPHFPNAVFFTTDLDARLIGVDQYDWTRNLVVASSFGFELTPCLQRGIAPFRGSYQTSVYLAARLALHNAYPRLETGRTRGCPSYPDDLILPGHLAEPLSNETKRVRIKLTQATVDAWLVTPRLFEIGRTQPFALLDSPRLQKNAVGNVHPGADEYVPSNAAMLAGLIGFGVTAGGILLLPAPRRKLYDVSRFACEAMMGCRGRIGWRVLAGGAILTVLVLDALLITAFLESMSGQGEPFLWAEGISTWPSELVRSAGLLMTLASIFAVLQVNERNLIRLEERFDFKPKDTPTGWSDYLRWRTRWRCRRRAMAKSALPGQARVDVRRVWQEHRALSSPECCMLRAVLWMLSFWLVGYVMMELLGYPNLPARGQAMARLNQFLILTLVPAFLTLLFMVVELTVRCSQLAKQLDPAPRQDDRAACTSLKQNIDRASTGTPQSGEDEPAKQAWPHKAVENLLPRVVDYPNMDPHASGTLAIDAYMRAMLLAERSAAVSPLVFHPLVILALLVVARARLFDGWNIPLGLVFVLTASFVVCCIVAWILHRIAERVRAQTIDRLNTCLLEWEQTPSSASPDAESAFRSELSDKQIQLLIERMRDLRIGAFRPAWEQPVVAAGLLPLVSAGGMQLLQSLGVLGF